MSSTRSDTCTGCGAVLPPEARFCSECGTRRPAQRAAAEERKVVTALFCDLVGFTAHASTADPEDVRARIRPYHSRLRLEIEHYGGTVEKFIGDAVMAVFGAPVTHEDDAERAVRAGLRILEAIEELNADHPALGLQVRIGVETGEVVVALDARPELGEGLVAGDVVNTASRLQTVAPVGGLVIGHATHAATAGLFRTEALPAATVKGKADPVQLWQVHGALSRLGVGIVRDHRVPMVGRDLELMLLTGLFDRTVRDRLIQLVTLVGEPGAGKSRLVAELGRVVDARTQLVRWREGHCLPYGDGITFWALGEIVKAQAGILSSDAVAQTAAKLVAAVPPGTADRDWLLTRLRPLVGLDVGTGAAGRAESFAAWRGFCESLASDGPAVLVFEDLHWADDELLAFLEHLVDYAVGLPILVICTARPELYERRADWSAGHRNATTLALTPLADAEVDRLAAALLESSDLGARARELVVQRAGGNPLYAEQFARSLRSDELAATMPSSVQALVAARLDTLPPERKELLQDAAVLGQVFWAGGVAAMGQRPEVEVREHLHELSRKELVRISRASSMAGEVEYTFWHAVVRDVAYGQIPRATRAEKHRRAAAWIADRLGDRAEDFADQLAHHHAEALTLAQSVGLDDPTAREGARRFLLLAGERAVSLDLTRAVAAYTRALDLTPEDDPDRGMMLVRRARALRLMGRLADAEADLRVAVDAATGTPSGAATGATFGTSSTAISGTTPGITPGAGSVNAAGRALTELADLLYYRGDPRHGEVAEQARLLLEQQPPGADLLAAYFLTANALRVRGDREAALRWLDRIAELAQAMGLEMPYRARGLAGWLRRDGGDLSGSDDIQAAAEQAEREGDYARAALQRANLAIGTWSVEGPAAALADVRATVADCDRRGLVEAAMIGRANESDLLIVRGELAAALELATSLEEQASAGGAGLIRLWALATQLRCRVLTSAPAQANLDLADQLVAAGREGAEAQVALHLYGAAVLAHCDAGQWATGRELLIELLDVPDVAAEGELPMALPDLVRAAVGCGDRELARRFTVLAEQQTPLHALVRISADAALAEAAGDLTRADAGYAAAARGWEGFAGVLEHAHALLGRLRCLSEPAEAAALAGRLRQILTEMGATALLRQVDG